MITHIRGILTYKSPTSVVVEAANVGYRMHVSLHTYSLLADKELNKEIFLYTHLNIKEDAHELFGFWDEQERTVFNHLISVSGIGPGTARMMLSSLLPSEIAAAIAQGDVATVQRIKGIGPKSAQRLILELQDKMKKGLGEAALMQNQAASTSVKEEALSALIALGITKIAAEKAIDSVIKKSGSDLSVENLIKSALKCL